uniref:Uncharacterized protein n=1 Tax=Panagrolaimus sp. JU765 TaxID=591449 RepID=A0AC34QNH3_9BILA
MGKVFRTNTTELIDELVDLIDNDLLSARVDPISLKLYKPRPNKTKQQSQRIATLQSNMEHRINAILIRASLSMNGVNVGKEQNEDDAAYPPGAKRGRRTAPGFHDFEDYDEDNYYPDDHEMISQTQQLSFYNHGPAARGFMQRVIFLFSDIYFEPLFFSVSEGAEAILSLVKKY